MLFLIGAGSNPVSCIPLVPFAISRLLKRSITVHPFALIVSRSYSAYVEEYCRCKDGFRACE